MARVIPNELLSRMRDVGGKVIADAEPDETDLDDLARAAVDVLQKYVAARHPESPRGVRIVHSETDDIKLSARARGDSAGEVTAGRAPTPISSRPQLFMTHAPASLTLQASLHPCSRTSPPS